MSSYNDTKNIFFSDDDFCETSSFGFVHIYGIYRVKKLHNYVVLNEEVMEK